MVLQVSDYHMASQLSAWIINGPTTGDNLQPFSWSQFESTSHAGLPKEFDFDFILVKPSL